MVDATPMRVNGKNWKATKTPFRFTAGHKTYAQRTLAKAQQQAVKEHEATLKAEKEAERQRRILAIKERREKKAEKERWAKMEEKMHAKKVERRRRREKRNRLLKS